MAALPPPLPQPQQVEEVHLTRFSDGFARVMNDFRILGIVLLLCILIGIAWGAVELLNHDQGTTALLYLPFVWLICHYMQRLARRR